MKHLSDVMVSVLKSGSMWQTDSEEEKKTMRCGCTKKSTMCCRISYYFLWYTHVVQFLAVHCKPLRMAASREEHTTWFWFCTSFHCTCSEIAPKWSMKKCSESWGCLFFLHSVCYLSCKSILKNPRISWVGITTIIKSHFWFSSC